MKKDWLFSTDEYTCGLRAAAVLVRDGKLLVQREKDGNEYALPGGYVKIGETLEDALIRETAEEMGIPVCCERLLWSEECFWAWRGRQMHTVAFYYLVRLMDGSALPGKAFVSQKDNCDVLLGWMSVEQLETVTIYPDFLKKEIFHLEGPIKHFISKN